MNGLISLPDGKMALSTSDPAPPSQPCAGGFQLQEENKFREQADEGTAGSSKGGRGGCRGRGGRGQLKHGPVNTPGGGR